MPREHLRARNRNGGGIIYPDVPWKKGNRLRVVAEDQADESAREVLRDVKRVLGIPILHLFYPALAAYPAFLKLHWELLRPIATSQEFFCCAERLRADSYTRAHNYFRIKNLWDGAPIQGIEPAARQEVTAALEFFHYKDPLILLLFCLQMQALESTAGQPGSLTPAAEIKVPVTAPDLVPEDTAPLAVRKRYEEIRRLSELPYVSPEFQALARWPEALNVYWQFLQQVMQSPLYHECLYSVRTTAWALAAELPGPLELSLDQLAEAGLTPEDIASIARIFELFVKNLSGMLLNVSLAKIGFEGGNELQSTAASMSNNSELPEPHDTDAAEVMDDERRQAPHPNQAA